MQNNQPTILITGAAGMMGFHFLEYYQKHNPDVCLVGIDINPNITQEPFASLCEGSILDIRNLPLLTGLVERNLPSIIYHLAAQSLPTVSWEKPQETFEINAIGTINLFEAILATQKKYSDYNPTVITACSSAEYGQSILEATEPITENATLLPLHPYGVSKVAQDLLSFQYWKNYGIKTIRARIFNTTGPRKTNDAVSDFVARAYAIVQGKDSVIRVGNLEARRAITDVRDMIRALMLLVEKGEPGETYNISGATVYQMKEIIQLIEKSFGRTFETVTDQSLIRPVDEPLIIGNSERLKRITEWKQEIDLETTIADMITELQKKSL